MPEQTFIQRLREEIEAEKDMLIAVGTREADIRQVNDEYKNRRRGIRLGLRRVGLHFENPWSDLWSWYGFYSGEGQLTTYQERRDHIIKMYDPILEALERLEDRQLGTGFVAPETGWITVDSQTAQLRERYATARTPEDYKAVGHLCREILISLGHVVFDPDRHHPEDEPPIKKNDAKRRIERVLEVDFGGPQNERLRKLVRSLWNYVSEIVHKADEQRAKIAADSTVHLVNTLRTLIREPPQESVSVAVREYQRWIEWEPPDEWEEQPPYEPSAEELALLQRNERDAPPGD